MVGHHPHRAGLLRVGVDLNRAVEDRPRGPRTHDFTAGRSCRPGPYILGLEPSCTAVPRSDAPDLLADHPGLHQVRDQSVTLAELLMDHTPGWQPPWLAT